MRPHITILKGDITIIPVDAIVNPANNTLLGGGGIDGAIHRKAGPKLLEECKKIRKEKLPDGLSTGDAILTGAYDLPAKHVIHVAGPIHSRDPIYLLKRCYREALRIAEENKVKSISIPAVSTGAYHVPVKRSAIDVKQAIDTMQFNHITEIKLVLYSEFDKRIYDQIFDGNSKPETSFDRH